MSPESLGGGDRQFHPAQISAAEVVNSLQPECARRLQGSFDFAANFRRIEGSQTAQPRQTNPGCAVTPGSHKLHTALLSILGFPEIRPITCLRHENTPLVINPFSRRF